MDASKVLAVADEIEAAETEAMRDFAPRDGVELPAEEEDDE